MKFTEIGRAGICVFAIVGGILLGAGAAGPAGASGPIVPAYSAAIAADAPRGHWRFGESSGATVATDSSGSGLNGTYGAKMTTGDYVGALLYDDDLAANFAGADGYFVGDDYVSMGNPAGLNFGTADFTVEAWVSTETNNDRPIVTKSSGSDIEPRWEIVVTDDPGKEGRVRAYIYDGAPLPNDVTVYGPSLRVDDGEFHHVVVVFDRDQGATIYVDRVAAQKAIPMTGSVSNSASFRVGGLANSPSFNGEIDEVAVYPVALSAARVGAHYDAGIDPPDVYLQETLSDAPTGYWRLGEPTTTAPAIDSSGNGVPATYGSGQVAGRPGALVGESDTAVSFIGTDGVFVGNPAAPNFGTADFAAEAWIKTSVNAEEAVVGKVGSALEPYWIVSVTDDSSYVGRVRATIFDGVASVTAYGPPTRVDDGNWHHVGVAFDRDYGIHVYVDGIEASTLGLAPSTVSNSGSFKVGAGTGYPSFLGDIDEVAVYDSLLEPFAGAAHYTAGALPSERVIDPEWDPALPWLPADTSAEAPPEDPPGVQDDSGGFRPGDQAAYQAAVQESRQIYLQSGGAAEPDPTDDSGGGLEIGPHESGLDAAAPPLDGRPPRPSDSTSSAGRVYLVEMVNTRIAVYRKDNLSQVGSARFLSDFIGSCDPFNNPTKPTDPQILWDRNSGRWYYVVVQRSGLYGDDTHNCLAYGWSKGPNPTNLVSGWCHFHTPMIPQLNDQPSLGDGGGWIVIGSNVFPSADRRSRYLYSRLHAFRKPSRRNASRCREPDVKKSPRYHGPGGDLNMPLSPKIANAVASQAYAYGVGIRYWQKIVLWAVRSKPGYPLEPEFSTVDIANPWGVWFYAAGADQPPNPPPSRFLDTTDGRFLQAVARRDPALGRIGIWTSQTVGSSLTRRPRIRWYQITPANWEIPKFNEIVHSTLAVFNGAVSPSWDHSMVMIQFNRSSTTQAVQVRTRARTTNSPPNQFDRAAFVWNSVFPVYHDYSCEPPFVEVPYCRWGDYPGASPDVRRRERVWGTNQVTRDPGAPDDPHWGSRNFAVKAAS